MSQSRLSQRELLILIEADCDAELSQSETKRLEQALYDDPLAQELYQKYILLDSELYWKQIEVTDSFPWNKSSRDSCDPVLLSFGNGSDLDSLVNPLPICLPGAHSAIQTSLFRWSSLNLALPSIVFIGGLWMVLAYLIFFSRSEYSSRSIGAHSMPLAMLTSEKDCVWQADSSGRLPHHGQFFKLDEVVVLLSGVAEFTFADGALVAVQGPATLVFQGARRVHLPDGKLAAHVPPQAIGFEVDTPTARVVDLGTAFRLQASSSDTKLAVSSGVIDLFAMSTVADSDQKMASPSQRLVAGQAVAVTITANGTTTVEDTEFDPNWLVDIVPKSSSGQGHSSVVAYQRADGATGNQDKFQGGVGLDFDVREPIQIYSLGVFDHLGNGIDPATTPVVQLWSRNAQNTPHDNRDDVAGQLLATLAFTGNDAEHLRLGHRFKTLAKTIDLPAGSYSIVAYGLYGANSFIEDKNYYVDFTTDPHWTGSNNDKLGNCYGWNPFSPKMGQMTGKIGGIFARAREESFYGDTALKRRFTLQDPISASGSFILPDVISMDGQICIGHLSSSTADDHGEFIGLAIKEGDYDGIVRVFARMYCPKGTVTDGARSSEIVLANSREPIYFDYKYDPAYEADGAHSGPEGQITLRVYSEAQKVDETVGAILKGIHRDRGAEFDAFGIGISAECVSSDDPQRTAELYLDDVVYSGFDSSRSRQGPPDDRIARVGSRKGECKPGAFPAQADPKQVRYTAGSFEYSTAK